MKLAPSSAPWRIPRSWNIDPQHRVQAPPGESTKAVMPSMLKAAFIFALVSMTVLDRFGLRVSEAYSINPSLFALYGLVGVMLLTHTAQVDGIGALIYVAVVTTAGLSFVLNISLDPRQYASLGSMGLLLVLYAPLAICLRPAAGTIEAWQWTMNLYIAFATGIAVAGIVQFYAQFVLHAPWLFDYTSLIPAPIRGSGVYNTTNHVGSLIKANGFFLREASGFSWTMAFALLCEWSLKRRKLLMATLALAIVVSYSGSGLLALGVAMLFPLGQRTVLRVFGCVVVGAIIVLVFGDALNLSYTLGRVGEFDSTHSSAYCRFILPGKVVAEQIDSDTWTTLLGHGPGTTQKLFGTCETTYAKVVIEYGLLGTIAVAALILAAINRSSAPIRIRVVLVVQWLLLGGNLLAPESLLVIVLISGLWPPRVALDAVPPRKSGPRSVKLAPRRLGTS